MKLGINEIKEAIYEKAIAKTIGQLQREGFVVERDYAIKSNARIIEIDLFAYNDYEKRIYEFKIGKNRTAKTANDNCKFERVIRRIIKKISGSKQRHNRVKQSPGEFR